MERISRESPEDYWPIMETLTAFVRERARWQEPNEAASETLLGPDKAPGRPQEISTDIAAVLSVIGRRDKVNRKRERRMGWRFDLRGTDLRRTYLYAVHLERANLFDAHLEEADLREARLERAFLINAHLEGAFLTDAHLEEANLWHAHLEETDLSGAHLEGAFLIDAHLVGANLWNAHLEGTDLSGTHLEGADLHGAHLESADLQAAIGLQESQLKTASGNAYTELPGGMAWPAAWPPRKSWP
jgi:uncharacterized protein YjbI with pentapeptide repeats